MKSRTYHIFLSHSSAQKHFVEPLYAELARVRGQYSVFLDRHSIQHGEQISTSILKYARTCKLAVVVVSEEYFTRSKWPMMELAASYSAANAGNGSPSLPCVLPVFFALRPGDAKDSSKQLGWQKLWQKWEVNERMSERRKNRPNQVEPLVWKEVVDRLFDTRGPVYIPKEYGYDPELFMKDVAQIIAQKLDVLIGGTGSSNVGDQLTPLYQKADAQTAEVIDAFLMKLNACAKGEQDFTFMIDDPSGNSYIENPHVPSSDPLLSTVYYERSDAQQEAMGFLDQPTSSAVSINEEAGPVSTPYGHLKYAPTGTTMFPHGSVGALGAHQAIAHGNSSELSDAIFKYAVPEEVMTFPSTCGACGAKADTRMFVTNIPYFKEVAVMDFACDACGYKNSELKPGGRIPVKGKTISLVVKTVRDLNRDVIKSDTATVEIPELELELSSGTLGGLVTTVEGLLTNISQSLKRVHGFSIGDSAEAWKRSKWKEFDSHLQKLLKVEEEWTLVLDDAFANSFIAPATDDFESDMQLKSEEYERTFKQNEDRGLNCWTDSPLLPPYPGMLRATFHASRSRAGKKAGRRQAGATDSVAGLGERRSCSCCRDR